MNRSENIMTKSQGVFKISNNEYMVITFTKSWTFKTEKAAINKWNKLVAADLV